METLKTTHALKMKPSVLIITHYHYMNKFPIHLPEIQMVDGSISLWVARVSARKSIPLISILIIDFQYQKVYYLTSSLCLILENDAYHIYILLAL